MIAAGGAIRHESVLRPRSVSGQPRIRPCMRLPTLKVPCTCGYTHMTGWLLLMILLVFALGVAGYRRNAHDAATGPSSLDGTEGADRIRTGVGGFAGLCLTSRPPRRGRRSMVSRKGYAIGGGDPFRQRGPA